MARPSRLVGTVDGAILRATRADFHDLRTLVCSRYPNYEWATFARFGWRPTPDGLVVTLASLIPPNLGDLDDTVGHVLIREPYTLRVALDAETHPLAVGVIHSHPQLCPPDASPIDDDMDRYYADYFQGFAPNRPYVSLIITELASGLEISGRCYWQGRWHVIDHVAVELTAANAWRSKRQLTQIGTERHARFTSAFGTVAAERLRRSTVAVIGAGGTGSAAIEVLARAGVGHLIVVDPDDLEPSNLERVHGSTPDDAQRRAPKASIARKHAIAIDPNCRVEAIIGSIPQSEVIDAVVRADVLIGCTDQQHSRLALSDVARRYLIPAIDCGVMLEGSGGAVTAQVIQCVRFLPADPCPLCRRMIRSQQLMQELMDPAERDRRVAAAAEAQRRGEKGQAYWRDVPQLNTVGYLTTMAGAMVAGYAIGWITGRFDPPFTRLQMNVVAPFFDVTDVDDEPASDCSCRSARGWADQGAADALITAPPHWPDPQRV